MKKLNISILLFVVILCFSSMAKSAITDVYIEPEFPKTIDDITIFISGFEVHGPVNIYDTDFFINGNSLSMDLYIETGFLDVQTYWDYSENIGTLYSGQYDLYVTEYLTGSLVQTYPLSFEVIPEPTSLIIFTIGSVLTFRRSRKRYSINIS